MKAVIAAFNQEKALVGAFSVIRNLRMELFEALVAVCAPIIAVAIHLATTPSGDTRILPASATTNTTHPAGEAALL